MGRNRPNRKPRIAVTMGDPCGVGPEIVVKALSSPGVLDECTPVIIGEPLALQRAVQTVGVRMDGGALPEMVTPLSLTPADICYGKPTRNTCSAVVRYIETAAKMALDGSVDAICTCPIHKAHLHEHGFIFPGHTEFLQNLTRANEVVMMLAGPRLRVSLVTIHHSLADVPSLISAELVRRTIRLTGDSLVRDFGMSSPRIAVAALNPHAGEGGLFGSEESAVIEPAIESFPKAPFDVSGPYSADTLFHRAYYGEFDAVIAMYHDQGLIPIKLVHFNDAVNVSLGLPIIRTSVDHGTAYNLAGTGKASDGSLLAALRLAASMVENRRLQR